MTTTFEHKFLVKLINAVKEYPQLYDYEKYPPGIRETQNECGKIWTIIGEELGETRELCKKKWQVVRGSYQRYLKQIDVAKVPYYLSSHMEFLLPLYNNKFRPETQRMIEENLLENIYSDEDDDNDDDNKYFNDEDDVIDNNKIENKSDNNDDDEEDNWGDVTNSMLKHEIGDDDNNDNNIQPFESISIEEEHIQLSTSQNNNNNNIIELNDNSSSKLPDTKYVNDMPFAIKLLNCIKKFPELYTSDGKYIGDPSIIWDNISDELDETKEVCRKKWRIIRGSYQRYLKKIDVAPTPYYLSEYMKFLLPYYGKKYLPNSHKYLINEYLKNVKKNPEHHEDDDIEYTDEYLDEINFIDINQNKRKLNENNNNLNDNTTQIKKLKIEDNNNDDFEDNGDLIFLKSLLPDLKLLDTNKKITFRISVLNLVKELLEK